MRQNVVLTSLWNQTNLLLTGFGYQNGLKWTDGISKRVWIQHLGRIEQGQYFLFPSSMFLNQHSCSYLACVCVCVSFTLILTHVAQMVEQSPSNAKVMALIPKNCMN